MKVWLTEEELVDKIEEATKDKNEIIQRSLRLMHQIENHNSLQVTLSSMMAGDPNAQLIYAGRKLSMFEATVFINKHGKMISAEIKKIEKLVSNLNKKK